MTKYYIDSVNGVDDLTIGGTLKNPFKTLDFCLQHNTDTQVNIVLNEGEYDLSPTYLAKIKDSFIITGQGVNTTLYITGENTKYYNNMPQTAVFEFRKLIFNLKNITTKSISSISTAKIYRFRTKCELMFKNVLFDGFIEPTISSNSYKTSKNMAIFSNELSDVSFYNCSIDNMVSTYFMYYDQTNGAAINMEDCYGAFNTDNYIVSNTNLYTSAPNYDSGYNILDTIGNSIGVHSGKYSWSFCPYIIWSDNKYYSILENFYDQSTQMYQEITMTDININGFSYYASFDMSDLIEQVTIGSETFRPIDKFDEFKLISNVKPRVYVNGQKSASELVVMTYDLFPQLFGQINRIFFGSDLSNGITSVLPPIFDPITDPNIYVVFSTDCGLTWQTIDNGSAVHTNCLIPSTPYSNMSSVELMKFETAKNDVINVGCSMDDIRNFDFNSLSPQRLRFAFVIYNPTSISTNKISYINWNYDENPHYELMSDSECDIDVFENEINIECKSNFQQVKVEVLL